VHRAQKEQRERKNKKDEKEKEKVLFFVSLLVSVSVE